MKYGYARCSTNESKQDINRQTRELKNLGIKEDNIFFEYESGTKDDRKELNVPKEACLVSTLSVFFLKARSQA